jgi:hypothetical protein
MVTSSSRAKRRIISLLANVSPGLIWINGVKEISDVQRPNAMAKSSQDR